MKVNRNDLLGIISKVKPGLDKKGIIEQAGHLIFAEGEVSTFNDQICVIHPFESEFAFSVKGDEFTKLLNGMSESEVDIELKEGTLHLKTKSTKAQLSTIVGEESKVEHLIAQIKKEVSAKDFFKPLPKEFLNGVYLCAFSANKDIATGVRACVAVNGDTVFSTDNIRASTYVMDKSVDELLIPAKDAMELCKYPVIEYGKSENWIHFRTEDGIIFNCKTMKGEYPFKMIANLFVDTESEFSFPTDLKDAVASVQVLAEGEVEVNKMVRVCIEKSVIVVKAENERGKVEKTIDFDNKGKTFEFIINPIFFAQVLSHATGFTIIEDAKMKKAQFESENFYHIMALPAEA